MKNKVKQSSYAALALILSGAPVLAHLDLESSYRGHSISNELLVDFGKQVAYAADKVDQTKFDDWSAKLEADGWSLKKIKGTTGSANNQVESVMAVMAFRGNEVVIAPRGTTGGNDWTTDFRFSRDTFWRGLATIAPMLVNKEWIAQADLKEAMIAGQFLKANDKIHNGFLQTFLSMWPEIKSSLIERAAELGISVSELMVSTSGHSLGAALQNLTQMALLNDSYLGYGQNILEKSHVYHDELDQSWFAMHEVESKENTNVKGVAMCPPRVFGPKAAEQFNEMVGPGNSPQIVNAMDAVPYAVLQGAGFADATTNMIYVDGGLANPVKAHTDVRDLAVDALNGVNKVHEKTYARAAIDAVYKPVKAVVDAASNAVSQAYNAASNAYNALANGVSDAKKAAWGYFGY